jgi:hypothetical protein
MAPNIPPAGALGLFGSVTATVVTLTVASSPGWSRTAQRLRCDLTQTLIAPSIKTTRVFTAEASTLKMVPRMPNDAVGVVIK